ncbi:penicillin-binding protein [Kineococcus gynurae]|uniref:Penicillin-binding protein n=1 Tax=Kineococcus gynurae TaxID=452979 RepID=A0ABV5LU56_9ACTN
MAQSPTRQSDARSSSRRPVYQLLAMFLGVSTAAGVLAAGLVMPGVAASGAAAREGVGVFNELPSDLGDDTLSEATRILWADGSEMARVYDQNRVVVPLADVAPIMQQAIVAIEDSRFYEHGPVDLRGIARAVVNNASSGDGTQGASTLTQQYVKNILVEQAVEQGDQEAAEAATTASGVEGYARKLREMKLAVGVEKEMSKDEILDGYLNVAYFYNGVYGIEAASRFYFSKSAKDLTLPEAALLAGLVQNPVAYNPLKKLDAATERRNVVLDRMLQLGVINQADHDAAKASPIVLNVSRSQQGCIAAASAAYFCDYVTRIVENDPSFGATADDRLALLRRGGLTIRTTLDRRVQDIAQNAANSVINPGQAARTAESVVKPGTGEILAMVQNTTFSPDDDQVGVTMQNYNVARDMGGTGGFQQGSTFKAFTLAAWLKSGKSLNSTVRAPARGNDPFSAFTRCGEKLRGGYYPYSNSEGSGPGVMTVADATRKSVNTAFVSMEKQLDLCDIADLAQSLGVYKGRPTAADTTGEPTLNLDRIPSMTLGTNLVTPLSVAGAYAAFAADGTFCKPIAIAEVLDGDGKPMPVPSADCKQVLDVNVARNVTTALQGGWTSGTAASVSGKGLLNGREVASKTGTTNDSQNVWFAAYTPQLASAVWVGHDSKVYSLNGERINGRRYGRVFGATLAGPVWTNTIGPASNALELPRANFTPGSSQGLKTVNSDGRLRVPSVVGRSVSSARSALQAAGFQVAVSRSRAYSDSIGEGLVAGQSARSADAGATITLTVSAGPDPNAQPEPTQDPTPSQAPSPSAPAEQPAASPAAQGDQG